MPLIPVAAVKGDVHGWWDPVTLTFTPATPGVAYQRRCAANVALREARSWYRIVDEVDL